MKAEKKISVWQAGPNELAAHFIIRHRVFVNEQGALVFTDIDSWDEHPEMVHVLAAADHNYAGTVRLYPLDGKGAWRGDRLAVLKQHRRSIVGAQLVRFATATAAAQGGIEMEASVQLANIKFFERLGWLRDGKEYTYLGLPHQPMRFDLSTAPIPNWLPRPDKMNLDKPDDTGCETLCPSISSGKSYGSEASLNRAH
jgi:putative N-acetyltransferase (TIGR04045 family)